MKHGSLMTSPRTFLAAFAALALARVANAQELAYCDLSVAAQTTKLHLNGATVMSTGARKGQGIVVTPQATNQRSTVFHSIPIDFVAGDSLYQHFRVRISGNGGNAPPNGADGFAFMVQNDPGGDPLGEGKTGAGISAVGRAGEGFAYAGITQSFALELDTYLNANRDDPNGNHVGFDVGGRTYHTSNGQAGGTVLAALAEGATGAIYQPVSLAGAAHSLESTTASYDTRDVWLDYVCASGTCSLKVYMTFNNTLLAAAFADTTNPATLPAKPATPILTVNGISSITQYLNGAQGWAGFSASTGASVDQHLVTYWVLSKKPFSDQNTNDVEDLCDCRNVPAACGGHIPICDLGTPQGFCRDCQTNAECAAADPTKPICDPVASGGTGACVECTSSANCTGGTPNCNTSTNTCTSGCTTDAQCALGQWCSNPGGAAFGGTCTAKLPNGTAIPTVGNHAPALTGTCTAAVGAAVCATGVCDTTDDRCGIAVGDGTCTQTTQCRSGQCVATGTNAGKCEPCVADAQCSGATPACNVATNQCVQCTATNGSACTGSTPICNTGTHACVPCNGNAGSTATAKCPASAPFCDLGTGSCSAKCTADSQCAAGNWCNDVTASGVCQPKLPNGTGVPGGNCTATLGGRACSSAVCDPSDDACGFAEGDGPCAAVGQCRAGVCVATGPNAQKCEPCSADAQCGGQTPACSATTNHCVECSGTNSARCTGATPFCNVPAGTCVGCTSDDGVASAHPCPTSGAPYCAASGTCGNCTSTPDCAGATHAGPYCVSGACSPKCGTDADCGGAAWCDGLGACDPKLPNGSPMPAVTPIDGKCTTQNGQRVCQSGVCDPKDDECGIGNGEFPPNDGGAAECRAGVRGSDGKCGYPNGEGPCTAQNGGTVCRSGTCGGDGLCGHPNGEGPCTEQNGGTVCRSGACDPRDGECGIGNGGTPGGDGGVSLPADSGAPVCRSGVVGSDGKCGYPDGEGPCTAQNGGTVCRSGTCDGATGLCGGGDAGSPRADSGVPRVDSGATRPDSGTPRVDSGTCPGGVVGSDGKCGYPNGEGPCTADDGASVCRSGACYAGDGKCGYPPGSGTCLGGDVCRTGVCDGNGVCGCGTDVDCGGVTSGRVCADGTHACTDGCRGTSGNGCPSGATCSSTTAAVGTCGGASIPDSLAGGGCACSLSDGSDGSARGPGLVGAALALSLLRRSRRRAPGRARR
ncbi:MAG TPA: L-type lectin-domain containing protein [Polyangiaceae bacterium]|nr:L-type lectin-domain containing protein [Polyangiaceae bacterium]